MLVIMIGKSGSGKTEISKHFPHFVSFTTRSKRNGEVDGVDYHYMDFDFIKSEIEKYEAGDRSFIVEYGEFKGEHDGKDYYGTLRSEFDTKINKFPIIVNVSEIEGALKMRHLYPDSVRLVWVGIDESLRIQRLQERAKETNESQAKIQVRIDESYRDHEVTYCDFVISNNGTLEEAIEELKNLPL